MHITPADNAPTDALALSGRGQVARTHGAGQQVAAHNAADYLQVINERAAAFTQYTHKNTHLFSTTRHKCATTEHKHSHLSFPQMVRSFKGLEAPVAGGCGYTVRNRQADLDLLLQACCCVNLICACALAHVQMVAI